MTMAPTGTSERGAGAPTLHLARWTVTSGSNVNSRGAVVISSGEHQWDASAEGNGAVDALFRAVDAALAGVLTGQPRLIAYDVHAVAEGPDAEGRVTVTIAPPSDAGGARATGRYTGETTSFNIIAASIDSYIGAINLLLAEEHWAGAAESAGNRKRAKVEAQEAKARRAELDPDEANHDTTAWFDR
jgi:LeuA allosteric (dimerisation) domain